MNTNAPLNVQCDFFEVLRSRRSIRAFLDLPIEEQKLRQILDATNSAPSAGNLQAYAVVLVRDNEIKIALGQAFIAEAPVVLAFCAHPRRSAAKYGRRGEDLYCIQDATIGCAYAQLAATALHFGSVWIGAFDSDAVAQAIGARHDWRPVALPAHRLSG